MKLINDCFKVNVKLTINLMGFPVKADYQYTWLENKPTDPASIPYISHIDFYSDKDIISSTGYRSYFFQIECELHNKSYESLQELVTAIAHKIATETACPQDQLKRN